MFETSIRNLIFGFETWEFDLQYEWDDLRSIIDDIQMNIKKLNITYYEICTSKTLFLHRARLVNKAGPLIWRACAGK